MYDRSGLIERIIKSKVFNPKRLDDDFEFQLELSIPKSKAMSEMRGKFIMPLGKLGFNVQLSEGKSCQASSFKNKL